MSTRLSIVIPTYNRRERLATVLAGLARQSTPADDFEVVIVDDGSTDDTSAWLAEQRPRHGLRPIRQVNGGPARARNAGVQAAQGELILFLDDDVEPTPDLVAEHLRMHEAETDAVVIGPLASLAHYRQPWVAWEQEKVEAQYRAMTRGDWKPTFRQFWTGNASLQKGHVLAAGGFDPEFLRAEDIELGWRLKERGLKFRFNPAARGLHHAQRSLESWKNVHRSYGRLEVNILGRVGDPTLIAVLGDNLFHVHPAITWTMLQALPNPRASAPLLATIEGIIKAEAALGTQLVALEACSVLANLLYWQASFEALGPDRVARVIKNKDERIRKAGQPALRRWLRRRRTASEASST